MKAGWEIKRLPDIAEYFIGLTYTPKDVGNVGTIVLRSSNVQNDELDLSDLVRVTCSVKKPLYVRKGDILMCSRNGSKRLVGKTAVIGDLPEEMTFGTFMTVIRSDCNSYISWFLRSEAFREQIGVGENTMINQITKYMLDTIRVPIPPLDEQYRIVTILGEAFDGIATAKANAEKNLENARALFESHLQSVFTEQGEGWGMKPLGELAVFRNGINFTKTSKGDPIRILGVKDFQSNHWAPLEALDSIIPDGVVPDSDTLQKNDIVFVRSNGNPELIGRCLLIGDVSERTTHSGFTIKARLQTTEVLPTYLCHFLKSGRTRREMIDGGNGANIKSLNQGTLSRIVIPVPSLADQGQIVQRLEAIQEETQRLASLYQQKLTALDALKKSLLHQAFSGKL